MTETSGDNERLDLPGSEIVEVETEDLDPQIAEEFKATAESTAQVFVRFARAYGVELPHLLLIGTTNFQQRVDELLRQRYGPDQPDYTVERLGGQAVAKNIPLNQDHSRIAIVAGAEPWSTTEPAARAIGLYLIAHELTHSVLERLRIASGALAGVTFPSQLPRQVARSITRISVDELRADTVASVVLGQCATKTVDGKTEPLQITDAPLYGPTAHRTTLANLLVTRVYPGWPSAVNRYRIRGMTLSQLVKLLFEEADQMMTLLGHAEAEVQTTRDMPELFISPAEGQPGATWLLGPVWEAVMTVAAKHASIPSLSDFRDAELAILEVGERELLSMWERLGVTFDEPKPDGSYEVHVQWPQEPPEC
jgi:hypothetical protein